LASGRGKIFVRVLLKVPNEVWKVMTHDAIRSWMDIIDDSIGSMCRSSVVLLQQYDISCMWVRG
jgi:hypothetical protein